MVTFDVETDINDIQVWDSSDNIQVEFTGNTETLEVNNPGDEVDAIAPLVELDGNDYVLSDDSQDVIQAIVVITDPNSNVIYNYGKTASWNGMSTTGTDARQKRFEFDGNSGDPAEEALNFTVNSGETYKIDTTYNVYK